MRALVVLLVMFASGVLGSYCRYIWEEDMAERARSRVIGPGIAASLVVPLFLSAGGNSLFSDILIDNNSVFPDLFLIAGFCVLAGVAAPNFVGALAKKALSIAREADRKAERAENLGEAAGDAADNVGQDAPNADPEAARESQRQISDPNQRMVFSALIASHYTWRSIGGIAQATNLPRSVVREALGALKSRGLVVEKVSDRTANLLYQARI